MIQVGKLNKKGTIERRVLTTNAIGEDITSYETFREVWAQIMPVSAREYVNGAQHDDDTSHILRFRHIPNLRATDRFIYCGRVFNFNGAPINYQEGNWMSEVKATEVTSEPDDETT
jgi:SPP1 family predicted phage head-tail adaptor